ncbi:MAG: ribonuclease P protein component [Oscillospiraceae bacterium]|nr:ribonuclease P protein component [Oscillospiraceae bacterium]
MLYTEVIKNTKLFTKLYKKGKFSASPDIVMYFIPNKLPFNRVGITAGKKIGNAVLRNRAKRIIRAAYRNCEELFPIGFDIIFVARQHIVSVDSTTLEAVMKKKFISELSK